MTRNVLEYLQRTVREYPDKEAYVDSNETISFSELDLTARRIGTALSRLNVMRSPVMIIMDKSVRNIVCFMGVVYSGNFYTPVDTAMPFDRLNSIAKTLNPVAIITDSEHRDIAESVKGNSVIFQYDGLLTEDIDNSILNTIQSQILDIDPVYVLFTSGSTGIPKGVTVNHRGIIDFTDWMTEKFNITAEDRFANQSPFYFDLSIGDLFCTLKNGCTNYIVPHSLFMFPVKLVEYLNDNRISIIFWVPSALCIIANLRTFERIKPLYLTRILFCGEVMPNKQLNIWRRAVPNAMFANLYGPCETVDASTYYIVDRDFSDDEALPIGYPCENTGILVLNEDNKPVQGDETGELCIRGCSVTMGYYNDRDKTKASIVQNPLNDRYNDPVYRTGDLVRYNSRGELMYVGRKDFQIKHMGHRIELGEIETALDSIDGIDTRACIYDEDKKRIVLFYKGKETDLKVINSTLAGKLPDYMMPGLVVRIAAFPYNKNGKIDRLQLKDLLKEH